jgi:VanZ family protein
MTRFFVSTRVWRVVFVVLVVVVAFFAVVPVPPKEFTTGWDKLNHTSAFAALALVGRVAFPAGRRAAWALALALLAYGGLIEIVQLYVPGRDSEWADLLGDTIGVAIGIGLAALLLRGRRLHGPAEQTPR